MLSSSNFSTLGIICNPLVHFELTSIQDERQGPSFNLLHVEGQFFKVPFIEEAILSPVHVFGAFVENQSVVDVEFYFWGFLFYSTSPAVSCFQLEKVLSKEHFKGSYDYIGPTR
jgi:hypothetical protein